MKSTHFGMTIHEDPVDPKIAEMPMESVQLSPIRKPQKMEKSRITLGLISAQNFFSGYLFRVYGLNQKGKRPKIIRTLWQILVHLSRCFRRDTGAGGHHAGDNNSGAPGRRDETRCPAGAIQRRHSLCDRSLRNGKSQKSHMPASTQRKLQWSTISNFCMMLYVYSYYDMIYIYNYIYIYIYL